MYSNDKMYYLQRTFSCQRYRCICKDYCLHNYVLPVLLILWTMVKSVSICVPTYIICYKWHLKIYILKRVGKLNWVSHTRPEMEKKVIINLFCGFRNFISSIVFLLMNSFFLRIGNGWIIQIKKYILLVVPFVSK